MIKDGVTVPEGTNVKAIYFPNGEQVRSVSGCQLKTHNAFHGDHDQDWILQTKEGKELTRYNVDYLESIEWDSDNQSKSEAWEKKGRKDELPK